MTHEHCKKSRACTLHLLLRSDGAGAGGTEPLCRGKRHSHPLPPGGKGDPIVLLHGFAQTSRMWLPLIKELAKNHTVIAPDLRGYGSTSAPADGYTKTVMARGHPRLLGGLGHKSIGLVGHDIGLMVAYAYAAQYPAEVKRIVLMDAFLPGVGDWTNVWLLRDLWHFHFHGKTPLALVTGASEPTSSTSGTTSRRMRPSPSPRPIASSTRKSMRSPATWLPGCRRSRRSNRMPRISRVYAKTPLTMPMLVLSGEKAGGQFLIDQGKLVNTNVEGVMVTGSDIGSWKRRPARSFPNWSNFLNR